MRYSKMNVGRSCTLPLGNAGRARVKGRSWSRAKSCHGSGVRHNCTNGTWLDARVAWKSGETDETLAERKTREEPIRQVFQLAEVIRNTLERKGHADRLEPLPGSRQPQCWP